jgi:hypothetical protein
MCCIACERACVVVCSVILLLPTVLLQWGVDYLKYDNCNSDNTLPSTRYEKMRDALNSTGRPIFYSLCAAGLYYPGAWGSFVANSWRTTGVLRAYVCCVCT